MVDKLTISGVVFYFNSVFAGDVGLQYNKNYNDAAAGFLTWCP